MPKTVSAVIRKAKAKQWQAQSRSGRGGGLEYHISSLPAETQRALAIKNTNETLKTLSTNPNFIAGQAEAAKISLKTNVTREITEAKTQKSLMKSEGLKPMAKTRMNAKIEVIKLWEVFNSISKESATASQFLFCSAYNENHVEAPGWVKDAIPSISQGSLMRWIKTMRREGVARLGGSYGNRKGSGILDTNFELNSFVRALIFEKPDITPQHLFHGIVARFDSAQIKIPSAKTICRWLTAWKKNNKALYASISNPDQFKANYMVAFGNSSENISRYNELWEMDSTPADIMLEDGRHTIIGVIDVQTRRFKMLVSKTSKSEAIAALVRRSMLAWGVPERIKTDNGKDYTSNYFTNTLKNLNIKQELCHPFSPWEKPHIERALGAFSHSFLELMPDFIGHNVAERKAIEERKSFADRLMKRKKQGEESEAVAIKMTAKQLQKFCDDWSDGFYFMNKHRELGKSPFEMVAAWQGEIRTISDLRALDTLLAPVPGNTGKRTITKKGISVDNFTYNAPELGAYVGENVAVFYDLTDCGKVVVYTSEIDFICVAECPEIAGVSRQEVAVKAKAIQKQKVAQGKAELAALSRTAKVDNIGNDILKHYSDKAASLSTLPGQTRDYSTEALEAAATAVAVMDEMVKPNTFEEINAAATEGDSPEIEKRQKAEIINFSMKRLHAENREDVEKKARVARYEGLLARNFEGISEEDERWRKSWEGTPEFFSYNMMKRLREENEASGGSN